MTLCYPPENTVPAFSRKIHLLYGKVFCTLKRILFCDEETAHLHTHACSSALTIVVTMCMHERYIHLIFKFSLCLSSFRRSKRLTQKRSCYSHGQTSLVVFHELKAECLSNVALCNFSPKNKKKYRANCDTTYTKVYVLSQFAQKHNIKQNLSYYLHHILSTVVFGVADDPKIA